jgi:pyrroline-5-carboxylate reductase
MCFYPPFFSPFKQQHIAILGTGTMGRTIATGLVRSGVTSPAHLVVTNRTAQKAQALARDLGVRVAATCADACKDADVVIICVKPNDMLSVAHRLRESGVLWPRTHVISIAAGVTTETIERVFGATIPVVRAMPNTPCLVGSGMTIIAKGTYATTEHLDIAKEMFLPFGRCLVLDEKHMNVVTGLSGSGPAFLYMIIEALADGGVMCGLPRDVATTIAAQVARGAAQMVLETERHPSALKDDVTTPGGCTIAGLLALEDGKIRSVLARAIQTAAAAAGQLGTPVSATAHAPAALHD